MSEPNPASGIVVLPHVARAPDTRLARVMPITESILWSPTVSGTHRPAPLLFIAQHTLRKIQDRLASMPNGLGVGLLAGRRYTDNRSGAQFVTIDGALPLPALANEDEPAETLAEGMRTTAAGIEILGWYRSHSFADAALTPADVDAHNELFAERSGIMLVVADGGEAGGIFRSSTNPAWPVETLPFYEWVTDQPGAAAGAKQTILIWRNYRAAEPVNRISNPSLVNGATAGAQAFAHPILLPDDDLEDEESVERDSAPAPWYRRFMRPALYAGFALGGAIIVAVASAILNSSGAASDAHSGLAGGNAADPAAQAAAIGVLDRRADTLALALTAFEDRNRMFQARQMPCAGLSRGLQQVEDAWLGYNVARRETLTPFDPTREARDRQLYADIRTAERSFERSSCQRP